MKNKTILLGLNELNFQFINFYIKKGLLKNFKKIFEIQSPITTDSEKEYHLLEPWIQWVTIHTGKSFDEHKVYRLGDIIDNPNLSQIFEEIENKGLSVGAVSPFNAENRLKNPKFFIPDPWTKTYPSGNWIIKGIYKAVNQSVNDNASSKFKISSLIFLLLGILFYVPPFRWSHYFKLVVNFKKPGNKAIILDSLLSDIFIKLLKRKNPDFSNLFLNSGAHIQHHYLFNSNAYRGSLENPEWYCAKNYDPLIKVLIEYDKTIGRLLKINNLKLIVATGLHQEPHEKITFYWRLNEHSKFINKIGIIDFDEILPRMSRDFLITFKNISAAKEAEKILTSFEMVRDGESIFSVDNREKSLFVELIYPHDISANDAIFSKSSNLSVDNFKSYISFVAIKNGAHNGTGYLTSNIDLNTKDNIRLSELNLLIKNIALN